VGWARPIMLWVGVGRYRVEASVPAWLMSCWAASHSLAR
jgi:hypothetical protein